MNIFRPVVSTDFGGLPPFVCRRLGDCQRKGVSVDITLDGRIWRITSRRRPGEILATTAGLAFVQDRDVPELDKGAPAQ